MRAITSRALLALTFASGLSGGASTASAADAPAPAASQPANAVTPAFAAPFNVAQDALKSGNGAVALAKLKELEALPNLTPYELYLIQRVRAPAEYSINDYTAAAADFESLVGNPLLPPDDKQVMLKTEAAILFSAEQYPKAALVIQRYIDAGGNDPQVKELLPQAQYVSKDYAPAAKGFRAEVDAEYAAGRVPTEKLLRFMVSAYLGLKDDAGYVVGLEHLAVNYPKPDYWRELISRAREVDNFSDRLSLDIYRLKAQVLGQVDDRERVNYAAIAARAGYPAEAKKVLDEAYATKPFTGADLADANKLRPEINKGAASDLAQQTANETAARNAKDGNALLAQGMLETLNGNAAKGVQLIQEGIAKGGLRQPEDAKLHLGYAQVRAGHDADALKTFQSVSGPNGLSSIAHVWVLYLQSRQAAAAAPAPAAAASK
jgi:hypothetical protein